MQHIEEDGIVTYGNVDEPLVALWDGGINTAGIIRDMCQRMRDVVDGEQPVAIYLREGDTLVPATLTVERPGDGCTYLAVTWARPAAPGAPLCSPPGSSLVVAAHFMH